MEKKMSQRKYDCKECFYFSFPINDNPCINCIHSLQKRVNNWRKYKSINTKTTILDTEVIQ